MNKKIKLKWWSLDFQEEAYFDPSEIIRVEQNENYSMIHIEQSAVDKFRSKNIIPIKRSCKSMADYLTKHGFCKTNRSNMINMDKILKVSESNHQTARVYMVNGAVVPVSKSHKKNFLLKWDKIGA